MVRRATSEAPLVVDQITLDGRAVQVRNVEMPLDDLALDPRNPRIANTVAAAVTGSTTALQRKLEALLWDDPDVHDLYRQIVVNQGLIERIIVREDGTVIEGNCRTVCYRKLRENNPADVRWQRIPSRVLPGDIGDRDIAILLGEMHVAGKNTWTAFEKAGHIYRLHRDFALTQDEIAQRLRLSKSKVNQLSRAFELMKNRFLPKYPRPSSVRKFSYFEEIYRNPTLREWITTTAGAEDLAVLWVGTGKLAQGTHVRDLPSIIADARAIKTLTEVGFEAALRVLGDGDPSRDSKLFRRMVEMTDALRKAQLDEIQRVRTSPNSRASRIVEELQSALEHFVELCGIEGRGSEK